MPQKDSARPPKTPPRRLRSPARMGPIRALAGSRCPLGHLCGLRTQVTLRGFRSYPQARPASPRIARASGLTGERTQQGVAQTRWTQARLSES
jgi:hypothetical protein